MPTIDKDSLDGRKVLFLGDSITDNGTYVSVALALLRELRPAWRLTRLASVGLSSENISGLSEAKHPFPRPCLGERLGRALEKFQPETVFLCYGMNDGIYCPQSEERLYAFRSGLANALDRIEGSGVKRIVLMTPPPFDPQPVKGSVLPEGLKDAEYSYMSPYEGYASILEDYSEWERGLAGGEISLIDQNRILSEALKKGRAADPSFILSPDGIHPGFFGHVLMACGILEAFGVKPSETPEAIDKRLENDPAYLKDDERRKALSEAWRAYIGYTRETTVRSESIDDALARWGWN